MAFAGLLPLLNIFIALFSSATKVLQNRLFTILTKDQPIVKVELLSQAIIELKYERVIGNVTVDNTVQKTAIIVSVIAVCAIVVKITSALVLRIKESGSVVLYKIVPIIKLEDMLFGRRSIGIDIFLPKFFFINYMDWLVLCKELTTCFSQNTTVICIKSLD